MTTVSYHVAPRSRATAISVRTPSMWAVIDGECCVRQAIQDDVSGFYAHEETDKARCGARRLRPRSRAVRALSAVTVLCPCIHQRNYQKQMLLLASRPDHEQVFAECCTEPFVKRNCGQIARVNRPHQRMLTRAPTGVSRVLHERSPHAGLPRLRRHEEIDD